jgi:hypothetical protein
MTDKHNVFEYARSTSSWDVYRWLGWTLYWNSETEEGKLYDPSGTFIADTFAILRGGFEALEAKAVWLEEGAR